MTNSEKITQAVATLVKLEGGRMDRLRLLKLAYLADRQSFASRGTPIIGGHLCALDHGPIISEVYDCIKSDDSSYWGSHFSKDGHCVVLSKDPGEMKLSPFETDLLTQIFNRFRDVDTWSLVELTHTLPEWKECWQPGTSTPIPIDKLLESVGFSQDEIEEAIAEEEYHDRVSNSLIAN